MTQKLDSSKKSGEEILQTIEPKGIADESMRRTVEILLNLIEQLQAEVKELRAENQQLKDDFNRLKGEQGKPDIKANKKEFIKILLASKRQINSGLSFGNFSILKVVINN